MTELEARNRLEGMADSMARITAALGLDNMSDSERVAAATTTSFMVDGLREVADFIAQLAPRVLTVEEMRTVDGVGHIEYNGHSFGHYALTFSLFDALVVGITDENLVWAVDFEGVPFKLELESYGKTWRFWNRRPSIAEREATPWTRE